MNTSLYFIVYEDFFKLGYSYRLRKRLEEIINDYKETPDFDRIFYINFPPTITKALEMSLKNKYNYIKVEGFVSTECFAIEDLESMKEDVLLYSKIFNLKCDLHQLKDAFVVTEQENKNIRLYTQAELDRAEGVKARHRRKKLEDAPKEEAVK